MQYKGEELILFKNAVNWKSYFARSLKKYIQGTVLEVGSGIGINAIYLHNSHVKNWTFLEPDENLAGQIKAGISIPQSAQSEIINGTIQSITNRKFDVILYIDVLEHIQDSKSELAYAAELLQSNGHLIILAPAHPFLFSKFDEAIGHFRRYNKRILKQEIPPMFDIVKIFYLDSFGAMASVANKLILSQKYPTTRQINFWDKILIPASRLTDPLTRSLFGKTIIGIFKKQDEK
jgi:ubiquinone/menaquinone biosynthesis C-methylase UbiE